MLTDSKKRGDYMMLLTEQEAELRRMLTDLKYR